MTKEEVYDLACKRFTDPLVMRFGDECILGYWVLREGGASNVTLMFATPRQGVVLVEAASSYKALAEKAGLVVTVKRKRTR